ncbi:MAG: glycosyltransferase family 2 protein [Deltaproteobacteria bacterium]|jgi:dolichol-phosphate mannosyltransferase|nr:glycosyltransferase family 2 protein [Deltaproteobacteria bacterium]
MVDSREAPQKDIKSATRISVIIPVYNEAGNLERLTNELAEVLGSLEVDWEVVFVDDGSSDNTWSIIKSLHDKDSRIRGLRLSRNFGHQYALLAGLANGTGDALITMDGDLQHPAALIPELVNEWRHGNMIVHTRRIDPPSVPFFKKLSSRLYYRIFSYLSGVKIESGIADFRLLDRKVARDILEFSEEGLFFRGIAQWVGYRSATVPFTSNERFSGRSKYSLKKMLKLAWNGITSFSIVPLRLGIFLGFITSLIAFAEIIYAVIIKIFTDSAVPGWASAVSILSFLFGVLFILLGIVGEYIGRILVEVRQRPRYLIAEQAGLQNFIRDKHSAAEKP